MIPLLRQSVRLCPGVPVYLAPWTACPPGGKLAAVGLPPGGQAVPGYLTPHPGYLHPRGASRPSRFISPPPQKKKKKKRKNYLRIFCYFITSTLQKLKVLFGSLSEIIIIPLVAGMGGKLSRAVYLTPTWVLCLTIFSSPVQSTGRASVVTLAYAFALALALTLALAFPSRHF